VLAGLDPQVVGFCLDTGHAMMGSDPPEAYLRALGDRLRAVHWHASNGKDDAHLFPSADPVAWGDFVEALDEIGYQEPVTVEAVPPDSPPLAESIEALRAVLQGARASRST
jgi:sugar phosphate isomerase/epimerase